MIQKGWREGVLIHPLPCDEGLRGAGVFVLHLVMNDSEGLEGGAVCSSPCDE